MQLDPDFREFVGSFIANDVRFLIVGGYAVAAMDCLDTPAISTPGFG